MTKTLSEQLCQLCGIKPQEYQDNNVKHYKYYPDFENNAENFVKLLKIINDILGKVEFATAYTKNRKGIFEEQVLQKYIVVAKCNESFKQAIKQSEWVY